jgi:hypothetical protein
MIAPTDARFPGCAYALANAGHDTRALQAWLGHKNISPHRFKDFWRFGNPGGSLEATRRSFNKDFLLALAADFKKHGAAAIEKVRKQQPAAYMKICALLVPREMKVEHSNAIKAMSDEQIEQAIETIQTMLEQIPVEFTYNLRA